MQRRTLLLGTAVTLMTSIPAFADALPRARLYKNPQCGCCENYASYLRGNGFRVDVTPTDDLPNMNRSAGIPDALQSCHLMLLDGYFVSGHVPANFVHKLIAERPAVGGIALPGMPAGSPGMPGTKAEMFVVYAIAKDGGRPSVYGEE